MPPHKICEHCARSFEWRKKWERCWDEVRYCSARCRKTKLTHTDLELEKIILKLLNQSAFQATICPVEVLRALSTGEEPYDQTEQARQAARRLAAAGQIEILQNGRAVDPSKAKGPIRLRKIQSGNR
jgi:hypothetical protein